MSDAKMKHFDELTSFLGDYGFFQILIIVLIGLTAIPGGYMGVIVVFVSDTPEHHCKESVNSTVGPDSCSRYKVNGGGTETARLSNDTEKCLDGWEFSTEIYTSTIVSEWELVCDQAWKVPFSTSCFFVGVLIGSLVCGSLSDRFGRKPVFFFTFILQSVTALIQASSVSWVMFCFLNCLRGLGQMSYFATAVVLGSEMLGKSARLTFSMLGQLIGYSLGYALLPLLAYFIRGWRMLLVASAIPGLLFIPMWWVIPESPRWLLQKGRVEEAELVIRKAAKMNRITAPEFIFKAGECLELMKNKGEDERTYTYVDLIRTPNIRNITVLGVLIWMSAAMVFFGLSLNTSNLNGNIYLNCFISAAVDTVVYVANWQLVNRAPRPTLLFCMLMYSGIMLLIIQLFPEDMPIMLQTFALVGKLGASGAFSFVFVFFTELMPTVVRNMGLAITSTAACIGTITCPYVIYIGMYGRSLPYIIFGTISIVAAAASMLLPDTRNSKLPDLISQAKPIKSCFCPKQTAAAQSNTSGGCEERNKSALC